MRTWFGMAARISALTVASLCAIDSVGAAARPKLIVLLVVDQMRGDYIDKFRHQWTGGLHRLLAEGAWLRQVDYPYFQTETCPGHASISTGSTPSVHGMAGNKWWDRDAKVEINCADDPAAKPVSYGKAVPGVGESAAALRTTTLADELRAQLTGARVASFSLKARSATTMAGRRPDAIAWFHESGAWVTSTAYSQTPVPAVADFITKHPVEGDFGKVWTRLLPIGAYLYQEQAAGPIETKSRAVSFPHALRGESGTLDAAFYTQWQISPYANDYLARMALDVAGRLQLQKTTGTNLLAVSFSSVDLVGHYFGPHSHEVQDVLIRLDRTLGDFLTGLDRLVGPGQYTVALTADHGVSPMPEHLTALGIEAGRISGAAVTTAIETALTRTIGSGKYVQRVEGGEVYLEPAALDKLGAAQPAMRAVRDALKKLPGIREVYLGDQLAMAPPNDPFAARIARAYFPGRSGDLILVPKPYWIFSPAGGTTHGTSYGYDTRVPILLMGAGIARGEYVTPAQPIDVAPTLAFLAGVTLPRAEGRVLSEALLGHGPNRAAASRTPTPVSR